MTERGNIPIYYRKLADRILAPYRHAGDLAEALAIARYLKSGPPSNGDAIHSNLRTTLQLILHGGRGYCSDYREAFTALAVAGGLPVVPWGMSFYNFTGDGHAFNEIYDFKLRHWVMIDSYNSLYFVDSKTGQPLSILELRKLLIHGAIADIRVKHIVPAAFGFRSDQQALNYYSRGMNELFLIDGDNVFTYDGNPVTHFLLRISRALAQGYAIADGFYPAMLIYPTRTNAQAIALLMRLRTLLLVAAMVGGAAVIAGLGIGIFLYRTRE